MDQKLNPLQRKIAARKNVDTDAFRAAASDGMTLAELSSAFDIKPSTAAQILERFFKKGILTDYSPFVTQSEFSAIEALFEGSRTTSLTKIATFAEGRFTEEQIRIVRGVLLHQFSSDEC